MFRLAIALFVLLPGAAHAADLQLEKHERTLAVVMTNDPKVNQIKIYDAKDRTLLQTLPTNGQGGAGNNARGVRQFNGELFAAVNKGSNSVAVFRRDHDRLRFDSLVYTTSAPISIDFGNGHMYVAGATTVDSFVVRNGHVDRLDGTTGLILANGTVPPDGAAGQVGVTGEDRLLVTLKTDPDPGTVDVIALKDGAIATQTAQAVQAPAGTLAPFGFAVYPDGTALITLAHSNQDGLFRDGQFTVVANAGQLAPCWMTRDGKYVFTANTASHTLSRLVGTGANVFVDAQVAATVATGNPTDLDAAEGVLAVIDHGGAASHLSFFSVNEFGELKQSGSPLDIGAANANGVAVIPPSDTDDDN